LEKPENLHVKHVRKREKDVVLLILKRLITGPAYPRELRNELRLSRSAVNYHLNRLMKHEIAKKLKDNRYAFVSYIDGEDAVIQAIKKWKEIAFRYPTIMEIANETGIKPENAELLAYKTKDKTGWLVPNEGIIENTREKLGEVLVCAGRMTQKCFSNADLKYMYQDNPEMMKEAERFLKKHRRMIPNLQPNGYDVASWPIEALKYLGKPYEPKARSISGKGVFLLPPKYKPQKG
jgi:DNA-binding transcriptional ArsR family regulator